MLPIKAWNVYIPATNKNDEFTRVSISLMAYPDSDQKLTVLREVGTRGIRDCPGGVPGTLRRGTT